MGSSSRFTCLWGWVIYWSTYCVTSRTGPNTGTADSKARITLLSWRTGSSKTFCVAVCSCKLFYCSSGSKLNFPFPSLFLLRAAICLFTFLALSFRWKASLKTSYLQARILALNLSDRYLLWLFCCSISSALMTTLSRSCNRARSVKSLV